MEMETSAATMNFHDSLDEEMPIMDVSTFFAESPILDFPEVSFNFPGDECNQVLDPFNFPGDESNQSLDPDDPLQDPYIWSLCNGTDQDCLNEEDSFCGGVSGFLGEGNCEGIGEISVDDYQPIPVYSVPLSQYNCSCCQRLRVITHTKGMNVRRLEIHGTLGIITHAILEKLDADSGFECKEFQMFDFHRESMQSVKLFLVQYFEACRQEGYSMEQDPLSTFYEALSVGLKESNNSDDFLQLPPANTGFCQNNKPEKLRQKRAGLDDVECTKIPLSTQRARTGKLKLKDLIGCFELPIEVAARKMQICPTVMKKICRKNGVYRWPYRKIRSCKCKIAKKIKILESTNNEEEKAQVMADILKHEQELVNIYEKFTQDEQIT